MTDLNNINPRPIKGESSFSCCKRAPFAEEPEAYQSWESLVKKLFIQFQLFYQYLGPDSAARKYLEKAKEAGYKNIDGTSVYLPENGDPFGESKKVNLQLYFADGTPRTPYLFADGCNGDFHFAGVESGGLFRFVEAAEFAPFLFPTHQNFYEESVNKTFTNNPKYDQRPNYPIYHELHKEVFTVRYFKNVLKIPPGLLTVTFVSSDPKCILAIRTLHFTLALLYAAVLLESAYIDIFGKHRDPLTRIRHLEEKWRIGNGSIAKGLNSHHLFILDFLLRLTHVSGYGLAASLFRLKNGLHSHNPGHGTWQIGGDLDHLPFKLFLKKQISFLVEYWYRNLLKENDPDKKQSLSNQIVLAVKLGELFGLGYQINHQVSKDYYYNDPVDFLPSFAVDQSNTVFEKGDLIANCNTESPLWRGYYLYSRKMWKTSPENQSVFIGMGETWELNKNHPRAVLYNIINEYYVKFMLEEIRFYRDKGSKENPERLQEIEKRLLEMVRKDRRQAMLDSLKLAKQE